MDNKNTELQNVQMEKMEKSSKSDLLLQRAEAESLEFMNPKRWEMMHAIANTFLQSGALPQSLNTTPKLMMVLQAGFEANLKPIEAINAFYFINGKLAMYGDVCISQVKRAGHKVEWIKCDTDQATCKITRGDTGETLETTYTMQMVKDRGINKNAIYQKYPENMLKFKAFHATAKFICPEALRGIPMKEELEEVEPEEKKTEVINTKGNKTEIKTEERPSLDDAIKETEPVEEEKKNPKKKVVKKKEPKKEESKASKLMKQGMNNVKETDDEKYERIMREGADRVLEQDEANFIVDYPKQKEYKKNDKLI